MENYKGRPVRKGPRGGMYVMTGKTKKYLKVDTQGATRLGQGQNGQLFKVSNKLALKSFTDDAAEREINMMLQVRRASFVPKIRYLNRKAGIYFMDLLPPGTQTLWNWLKAPHSAAEVQKVYAQIHKNVAELHRKYNVSHGDLHEDNIMVDPKGKVWIIDFGRAQKLGGRNENQIYTPNKYYSRHGGASVYNFGFLARKNRNMLAKYV